MTGCKNEPQQVVADIIVERRVEIVYNSIAVGFELVTQLFVFALEQLVPSEVVDRAMFGRRHQPRARVARNPLIGPLFEGCHERVVREIFGKTDIAHDSR
jgi:hypothetical protein